MCLSVVSFECRQVEVSVTGRSPVQMSPTECDVSECDLGTSKMRRPRSTEDCRAKKNTGIILMLQLFSEMWRKIICALVPEVWIKYRQVSITNEIKLGKTLIRPVLPYGSETWVLSKSDEAILGVIERKILRAIFGPTNDNGEWRIKYNNELYSIHCTRKVI